MRHLPYILGVILIVQFIVKPIYIKIVTKMPVPGGNFNVVSSDTLPLFAIRYFNKIIIELATEHFAFVSYLMMGTGSGSRWMYLALLENKQNHDTALGVVSHSKLPDGTERTVTMLEFSAEFEDGFVLDLNNNPLHRIFKSEPDHIVVQLSEEQDSARLYRTYLFFLQRLGKGGKISRDCSNPVTLLEESANKELMRLIKTGYLYLSSPTEYRQTWKGAFITTWKLIWPIKPILEEISKKRSRELSAKLGAKMYN